MKAQANRATSDKKAKSPDLGSAAGQAQAAGDQAPPKSVARSVVRVSGRGARRVFGALVTLAVLVGAWWAVAVIGQFPTYILPTPADVAARWWELLIDGSLFLHFRATVLEAGLGFLVALVLGVSLGYLIAHSRFLERTVSPYIAVTQGLPVVALAPLLMIWIGDDLTRKVMIVVLIVFFPILVNTIVGLRSIDRSMLEVARISGANVFQTIRYLELPLSLRAILGGVKLGLTLSITGAVVAEFISSDRGLGFLIMKGRGLFQADLTFVGLASLALLTLAAYLGVTLLERAIIDWE
jgi:NitT/TauT family transport system permease protein